MLSVASSYGQQNRFNTIRIETVQNIQSVRNPLTCFIKPAIVCLLFWGGGVALSFFALKGDFNRKSGNDGAMLMIGVCFFIVGIYFAYSQITKFKRLFIDTEKVLVDKRLFFRDQIEKVYLTKRKVAPVLSLNMGTIIFKLKDQTEFIIYDTLYSNSREMKIFLENYYGDVVDGRRPVLAERVLHDSFETFYTYKGNLFTSFRFYFLIFWIVAMFKAFQTVFYFEFGYGIVFGFLLIIITLLMCRHFNYFQLSDQTLTIHSHFYFWNRSKYELSMVRNVIFEKHSRGPKSIRIIQNDFKEYNFPAASLDKQDWIDLKKNLEAAGIPVDVESLD